MNRNSSLEALVLSTRAVGEDSRLATILSPQRGIFSAMVYGGRKGKLRSTVSPYHVGTMWIYSDVVKDSIKVTDFDPVKCRVDIRNNLYKVCAAALCAELVIKTHGLGAHGIHSGGADGSESSPDEDELWVLVNGFLDGLDVSSEEASRIGTLRFLWRYIGLMGLQSDCSRCMHCGSNMISCYSALENIFSCADCVHTSHSADFSQGGRSGAHSGAGVLFYLGEESVDYLRSVNTLSPKEVRAKQLHAQSIQELHELLYFLIRNSAESKLKTLDAGRGIL